MSLNSSLNQNAQQTGRYRSLRPEQERSLKTKLRLAGTELSRRLGAVGSLT